jgi:uncharacterized protein YggE
VKTRFLLLASLVWSQFAAGQSPNTVSVTGSADIKVVPDQVLLSLGVESRDRLLAPAKEQNDKSVKKVLAAIYSLGVDPGDVQTGFISVEINYNASAQTIVDHYQVEKAISVTLRDVSKFEALLTAVLEAGANHIYNVEFATTELRKYRDQARAMAAKAAIEKANDLAAACGMKVSGKPLGVSSDSFGGGFWYGRRSPYQLGANISQNVYQAGGGAASEGAISLGKVSVTASVTMSFRFE